MEQVDSVVVGAGVVGLAVARALALAGREVVIVEAEGSIGSVTSARNSEVMHAGLYSPPDWLKTQLCIEGRRLLYPYCEAHGIPHRRCGKLVVATSAEQVGALERLASNAQANGVEGLQLIDGAAARAMEPALHAVAALHSSATGIIDSHAFMLALLGDAEDHGAALALQEPAAVGASRGRRLRGRDRRRPSRCACTRAAWSTVPGWRPATWPRASRACRRLMFALPTAARATTLR